MTTKTNRQTLVDSLHVAELTRNETAIRSLKEQLAVLDQDNSKATAMASVPSTPVVSPQDDQSSSPPESPDPEPDDPEDEPARFVRTTTEEE